jgi:hypothetical protein
MPLGGTPKCPKCGKAVYAAEKQMVLGSPWHKICVKCETCGKKLEPGNLSDNNGKIYCKPCYAQTTGMKGYGFGGAGGALASYQSYGSGESQLVGGDQAVEVEGGVFKPVEAREVGGLKGVEAVAAPAPAPAGGFQFCSECGTKCEKAARFCSSCGSGLGQ